MTGTRLVIAGIAVMILLSCSSPTVTPPLFPENSDPELLVLNQADVEVYSDGFRETETTYRGGQDLATSEDEEIRYQEWGLSGGVSREFRYEPSFRGSLFSLATVFHTDDGARKAWDYILKSMAGDRNEVTEPGVEVLEREEGPVTGFADDSYRSNLLVSTPVGERNLLGQFYSITFRRANVIGSVIWSVINDSALSFDGDDLARSQLDRIDNSISSVTGSPRPVGSPTH